MKIFALWVLGLITVAFCVGTFIAPSDKVITYAVCTVCSAFVTLVYGTYLQHHH